MDTIAQTTKKDVITNPEPVQRAIGIEERELMKLKWLVGKDKERMDRIIRSIRDEFEVRRIGEDLFEIRSRLSGETYNTTYYGGYGDCTCPDFTYRSSRTTNPCKHLYLLKLHLGGIL